jgi:DNA polymerase elongation subunit (family B)
MYFYTNVDIFKSEILLRGYKDGKRLQKKIKYKPYLFIPSNKENEYHTVYGESVSKLEFDTIGEAREFVRKYKDIENFKIYGMNNYVYPFINDEFNKEIEFDSSLIRIGIIDIECNSKEGFPKPELANQEITAISMKYRGIVHAFGFHDYIIEEPNVNYYKCHNEIDLLQKFVEFFVKCDIDVLTGWNLKIFDIPYLVNRIYVLLGSEWVKKLSPWNLVEKNIENIQGREFEIITIRGISIIDYIDIYKKFAYTPQESYKLGDVCQNDIGEGKLDYSEYASLQTLYEDNFQKFMTYNIKDVNLVDKLDGKHSILELVFGMSYFAKINYIDTLSPVRTWDSMIHSYLLENKLVIPFKEDNEKSLQIEGAFVKEPKPGMYGWLVSIDATSLYPKITIGWNMSPEKIINKLDHRHTIEQILNSSYNEYNEYLKENNLCLTAKGIFFDRNGQGFIPHLMEKLFSKRVVYKKLMLEWKQKSENLSGKDKDDAERQVSKYKNLQMSTKILLNSGYGAVTNQYFRWYNDDIAESITLTGQLVTKWGERAVNGFMNKILETENVDYVIAADTDSLYINFNDLISKLEIQDKDVNYITKIIDKICEEKINKIMENAFEQLYDYVNVFSKEISFKRETIANRGIWTAKKRYILNAINEEGVQYTEPKLKITGIEAIKTSTPHICREKIKECLKLIMKGDETVVQEYISNFKVDFYQLPFEEISFPRGCNGIEYYSDKKTIFTKGTPLHVKGALMYNNLLKEKKLDKKYPLVQDGDKIKYCYLILPNILKEKVISVPQALPKEFELENYINYDLQFEKSFLDPLNIILNVVGWSHEKKNNIMDFFN